jgi:hypothetical protein
MRRRRIQVSAHRAQSMCHMRRRRIHVSYDEEEDTCICTQGTKHSHQRYPPPQTCVAYEEEDTSSYLKHMYPPPHMPHPSVGNMHKYDAHHHI